MRRILITGATSAIAQEAARHFAADGDAFLLVGRDSEKLAAVADDLRALAVRKKSKLRLSICSTSRAVRG